jgi:hypothetical protein
MSTFPAGGTSAASELAIAGSELRDIALSCIPPQLFAQLDGH